MIELGPHGIEIALISVGITLLSSVVRHFTLDKQQMKEHKEKMKEHKEKAEKARKSGDMKAFQKHQSDLMEVSMTQMRAGFKPMMYTMIPILLIFSFMSSAYGGIGSLNNVTVSDVLPQGMDVSSISLTMNGTYDEPSHAIVWELDSIKAESKGSFNVTFVSDGNIDYSPTEMAVAYTTWNQTFGEFEFTSDNPPGDSVLKLEKSQLKASGAKVSYTIEYENTGDSTVLDIMGTRMGWFWSYFVFSFVSSIIFNKLFGNT